MALVAYFALGLMAWVSVDPHGKANVPDMVLWPLRVGSAVPTPDPSCK